MSSRRHTKPDAYEDDRRDDDDRGWLPLMELLALTQCAKTSTLGMADRGNPEKLRALAARNMVASAPGGGYKITPDGLTYIRAHRKAVEKL